MKNINPEIPEKVIDLIEGSGHDFHSKVARWFSENGWEVVISPYYMDQVLNKAREIDLIAEKPIYMFGESNPGAPYFVVRLFIECKFIASSTVFWFADKDIGAARKLVCRDTPFKENNTNTDPHHYLRDSLEVAKLFATTSKKNNDQKLKSQENDPFYRALNQVLNAMTSMRRSTVVNQKMKAKLGAPVKTLDFPVVLCSSFDDLYAVDFYKDSSPRRLEQNFQFEVLYAYVDESQKHKNDYFLIDFVEFDQLDEFSASIGIDAEQARWFLAGMY